MISEILGRLITINYMNFCEQLTLEPTLSSPSIFPSGGSGLRHRSAYVKSFYYFKRPGRNRAHCVLLMILNRNCFRFVHPAEANRRLESKVQKYVLPKFRL